MASDGGYRMPPEARAFAPPEHRGEARMIEQLVIRFPSFAKAEYRWRFADGTHSSWRPAPTRDLLMAPPDARGIDWRERVEARPRRRKARKPAAYGRSTPTTLKLVR